MDENDLLEELKNQDWKTMILKAANYVQKKLQATSLVKGSKQFARGTEAKEIVFKAIELLFVGERKWNKKVHPELFQHLISTINSLLYEHLHSFENKKRTIINETDNEIESDSFWDNILSDSSPKELIEYKEILDECLKIVEDETELTDLLLYVIDDYDRTEIAQKMNKSIKEIDNMKKRLRRKLNNELNVRKVGIPK
ncbi:MAG: hypothetical protein NTZ27_11535 [Ignavibacteriales bacterium]|nr:hypothetical protein [Ignavibacteriales bacterium]